MPNTLRQAFPRCRSMQQLREVLKAVLASLEGVRVEMETTQCSDKNQDSGSQSTAASIQIRALARHNTWSRAARRKNLKMQGEETVENVHADGDGGLADSATDIEYALEVIIRGAVAQHRGQRNTDSGWSLECVWVRGRDRALFESFWSHVSRKTGAALDSR